MESKRFKFNKLSHSAVDSNESKIANYLRNEKLLT